MSATSADVKRMQAIASRLNKWDIRVVYWQGWDRRGNGLTFQPRGLVCHWDASSVRAGEWGSISTIIQGRSDVPPPLSNFQGARCLDGVPKVGFVAAGRANHAGLGGPYRLGDGSVIPANSANRYMMGAEWAWAGGNEELNAAAKYAYSGLGYAVREVLG